MQCPSCGFENMPGFEKCCICSTALTSKKADEPLLPPRSKDRSPWEKLTWAWRSSPIIERIRASMPARPTAPAMPRWWNLSALCTMFIAIIPGFAHLLILRKFRTGLLLFVGSLAALGLAVLLYKSPVSNWFLMAVVGLSVGSVWSVASGLLGDYRYEDRRLLAQAGVALMVISIYLTGYLFIRQWVVSFAPIYTITGNVSSPIQRGDTVLLSRNDRIERGDIVVARIGNYGIGAGPVIGMPGDTVYIDERIYVNGKPVSNHYSGNVDDFEPGQVTLADGYYWVMPDIEQTGHGLQMLVDMCTVSRADIVGKATWVLNPATHRGPVVYSTAESRRQ